MLVGRWLLVDMGREWVGCRLHNVGVKGSVRFVGMVGAYWMVLCRVWCGKNYGAEYGWHMSTLPLYVLHYM